MIRGRAVEPVPLWEPKFSKENLIKLSKNPEAFERGFRMQAITPGDLTFPSFALCYQPGVRLAEVRERRYPAYVGVDLASDKRPGNAIVVLGHEQSTGYRYLLEVIYGNWTSPQTAGFVAEVASRHNVQVIHVENNAYQQSLIDWIKKEKGVHSGIWMKVHPFTTGMNKAHPEYGVSSMEVELKNRSWILPSSEWADHDATCMCGWCHFAREMSMYPRYTSSDGVMAAWFARDAVNKWGQIPGSGLRVGDLNAR